MLPELGLTVALLIAVYFDGVPLPCLVDTGSEITSLTETAAQRVAHALTPLLGTPQFVGAGPGAVIPGRWVGVRHVGTTHLGWPAARVAVSPDGALAGYDCLLGADLLSQHGAVVVDWQRREVRPIPPLTLPDPTTR